MRHMDRNGGRRWTRQTAGLLLLGLLLGAGGGAAWADACSSCPPPGEADIKAAAPEFGLDWRSGWFGISTRDYLEIDAGECTYALAGPPAISLGKSWLVLRGAGSVWNCPWGRSDDLISYEIEAGDSTRWSLDASVGGELKTAVLRLLFDLDFHMAESTSVREVRKVSKRLAAGFGHVLDWSGYFELADVVCDLDVDVTRRWSWWTKNSATGAQVHQKGVVWMDCGNEQAQLTRRASIGYSIRLLDSPCDDPTAPPIDRGTFPRNPPPVVTPSDDPPVPGNDEGAGPDAPPEEPLDPEQPEPRERDEDEGSEPRHAPEEPRAPGEKAGDLDEPDGSDEPEEPPPAPPAAPTTAEVPGGTAPTESAELGDAPTGTLPHVPEGPEGFGGPTAPGAVPSQASGAGPGRPPCSPPSSGASR